MKRTTTVRSIALVTTALTAVFAGLFARPVTRYGTRRRTSHTSRRGSR